MNIVIVAGARPNFIKIAPIIRALEERIQQGAAMAYRLVHTGQHFDKNMSASFFEQLGIPTPNANLKVSGGTQAEQTAGIMVAFEKELMANPTDLVIVVGDVTSTMACAIVTKKLKIQLAHVEAGIRSLDLTMPEEINRMVTDSITDYFFTTSRKANKNLLQLGVPEGKIFFVGNVMIDTLLANKSQFQPPKFWKELQLEKQQYLVLTMHRPANVDQGNHFVKVLETIVNNAEGLPIVFPVHPRTRASLEGANLTLQGLHLIEPLGYLEFNYIVQHAKAVITDSGGITEETTVLGIPCITLRDSTERPETVEIGTNALIGTQIENIAPALQQLFAGEWKKGGIPELWDGEAAKRIVAVIENLK